MTNILSILVSTLLAFQQVIVVIKAPAGGAPFSDDFNRSDSDSLGSCWVEEAGDGDIAGNEMLLTTGSFANHWMACSGTPAGGANQWVKVTASLASSTDNYPQIILRFTNAASPFYFLEIDCNVSQVYWNRADSVGGSTAQISSAVDYSGSSCVGQVVGATITGTGTSTIIRFWLNPTGSPSAADNWNGDTTPDATFTDDPASPVDSGNIAGLAGQSASTNQVQWDDYSQGAF